VSHPGPARSPTPPSPPPHTRKRSHRVFPPAAPPAHSPPQYGGFNENGPIPPEDSLWVYHLNTQTWDAVVYQQPAPPPGAHTGTFVANHFYMYIEPSYSPGAGGGGTPGIPGALWRWSALPAPTPSIPNNNCASSTATGHTAGIVIGILIGLGNLYYLYKLAENQGIEILPSFISNAVGGYLPFCKSSGGGGGMPYAPASSAVQAGDYAAAPTSSAFSGSSGYAAPSL